MKSILTVAVAALILAMPVHAADKPAAADKMSQADYEKAKAECKEDAKCLSDLEAKKAAQ
jgi:hypothetical protein